LRHELRHEAVEHQKVDRAFGLALFTAVSHHLPWASACATSSHAAFLRYWDLAAIDTADRFGQAHRAGGASRRAPHVQASTPLQRSLPDHGRRDPLGAQPVARAMVVALALPSRHAETLLGWIGSSREASGNVDEPGETLDVPRWAMRSSSSPSASAGRTDVMRKRFAASA
jgi:hypothetical protein